MIQPVIGKPTNNVAGSPHVEEGCRRTGGFATHGTAELMVKRGRCNSKLRILLADVDQFDSSHTHVKWHLSQLYLEFAVDMTTSGRHYEREMQEMMFQDQVADVLKIRKRRHVNKMYVNAVNMNTTF